MLKEKTITLGLTELGYVRCGRFVYKAGWSTPDVEHYLYFSTYGTPREFLTADFGVRNEAAQLFGVKCIQAYGGAVYDFLEENEPTHSYMRFPLGKIAGWNPRWSLTISAQPDDTLVNLVMGAVRDKLFPVIREVTDLSQLLLLLMRDEEPVRWVHVNGAMRAAQIAYLARVLGIGTVEIRSMLRRRENELFAHLKGSTLDSASYIERVIDDTEIAVRAANQFS
jgi:hypothetical protein